MPSLRRTAVIVLFGPTLALALAGCGDNATSPSPRDQVESSTPSSGAGANTTVSDLSVIGCATDDPDDVGELTGAWAGSEGGIYYIRQVGDCVWWFGTELRDIERGLTGQPGFANVASGRMSGTRIEVEWADVPVGNILGGGGLTLEYDQENNQLVKIEQRGVWEPFGASIFTRIEPTASPSGTPSQSTSP